MTTSLPKPYQSSYQASILQLHIYPLSLPYSYYHIKIVKQSDHDCHAFILHLLSQVQMSKPVRSGGRDRDDRGRGRGDRERDDRGRDDRDRDDRGRDDRDRDDRGRQRDRSRNRCEQYFFLVFIGLPYRSRSRSGRRRRSPSYRSVSREREERREKRRERN